MRADVRILYYISLFVYVEKRKLLGYTSSVNGGDPMTVDGPDLGITNWGAWRAYVTCPFDTRITGFRLRVEGNQGVTDDTALNGIQFSCEGGTESKKIEHIWGSWTGWKTCDDGGYVTEFDLKGMPSGKGDDFGATNVRVKCSGGDVKLGSGLKEGSWIGYQGCQSKYHICGARAKIEGNRGAFKDDTALNRLQLRCCYDGRVDIDRCKDNPCHSSAVCESTKTSFKCTCACGYVGNGTQCEERFKPVIKDNRMILIASPCAITRGNLLATMSIGKEYMVKFDLFPGVLRPAFSNIIHFTAFKNKTRQYGSRLPAVWFDWKKKQLHLCSAVQGNNYCTYETVSMNGWSNVVIKQRENEDDKYRYTININGKQIVDEVNPDAKEFENVDLYVADPWYQAQPGYIRNLSIDVVDIDECQKNPCHAKAMCENTKTSYTCTCACGYIGNGKQCVKRFSPIMEDNIMTLVDNKCAITKSNLLTTVSIGREYTIKFDVFPTTFKTGWNNVIHFTTSSNNNATSGDKLLAVSYNMNQLYLCSAVNGDKNFCKGGTDTEVSKSAWSTLEIKQRKNADGIYMYTIEINDKQILRVINNDPKNLNYVNVYVGDKWSRSQQGYIRKLSVEKGKIVLVRKQNSTTLIIIVVMLLILVIISVVIVSICIYRRRKGRDATAGHRPTRNEYEVNAIPTNADIYDYAVPVVIKGTKKNNDVQNSLENCNEYDHLVPSKAQTNSENIAGHAGAYDCLFPTERRGNKKDIAECTDAYDRLGIQNNTENFAGHAGVYDCLFPTEKRGNKKDIAECTDAYDRLGLQNNTQNFAGSTCTYDLLSTTETRGNRENTTKREDTYDSLAPAETQGNREQISGNAPGYDHLNPVKAKGYRQSNNEQNAFENYDKCNAISPSVDNYDYIANNEPPKENIYEYIAPENLNIPGTSQRKFETCSLDTTGGKFAKYVVPEVGNNVYKEPSGVEKFPAPLESVNAGVLHSRTDIGRNSNKSVNSEDVIYEDPATHPTTEYTTMN